MLQKDSNQQDQSIELFRERLSVVPFQPKRNKKVVLIIFLAQGRNIFTELLKSGYFHS